MAEALVGLERDDGVAVLTLSAPPANTYSDAFPARVRERAPAFKGR